MNPILQECLLSLIGLGHHILAMPASASLVKRNMLPEIMQNLKDFSTEVQFILLLQQTPVLVVTITKLNGDPETTSSTGDNRLVLKMSNFQKQNTSQTFCA